MKSFPRLAIYHGRENQENIHRGKADRDKACGGFLALHAHFALRR